MSDQKDMPDRGHNPLDGYERFLIKSRKARFRRIDTDSMAIEADNHTLDLYWSEDDEALHCTCTLDMQLAEGVRDLAAPIVMHINRRQWLGHFEVNENGFPAFRYTMLFHGAISACDTEVIEEVTDIATRACEQFGPAFTIMAQAADPEHFPRIIERDGNCAPLGLALLESGGRG
jgi:hypothetical protein